MHFNKSFIAFIFAAILSAHAIPVVPAGAELATREIVVESKPVQLDTRRHGDSRGRTPNSRGLEARRHGDSHGRRELDARRHGDSHGRRELDARRHGDSHGRRELDARRHGDSHGRRELDARRH
ncbi:hypothetical protein CVT25_005239, partial [Psilocybe cyanescens]